MTSIPHFSGLGKANIHSGRSMPFLAVPQNLIRNNPYDKKEAARFFQCEKTGQTPSGTAKSRSSPPPFWRAGSQGGNDDQQPHPRRSGERESRGASPSGAARAGPGSGAAPREGGAAPGGGTPGKEHRQPSRGSTDVAIFAQKAASCSTNSSVGRNSSSRLSSCIRENTSI